LELKTQSFGLVPSFLRRSFSCRDFDLHFLKSFPNTGFMQADIQRLPFLFPAVEFSYNPQSGSFERLHGKIESVCVF
jgi:hypothetical protein